MLRKSTILIITGAVVLVVFGMGQPNLFGGGDTRAHMPLYPGAGFEPDMSLTPNPETYGGWFGDYYKWLFGLKIAGTYTTTTAFGGGLQIHADGTLMGVSNTCCGSAPFPLGNIQSEGIGNWERTDWYQIQATSLLAGTIYDLDTADAPYDDPATEDGAAIDSRFACKVTQQFDFAQDFDSYDGQLVTVCWYQSPTIAGIYGGVGGPIPDFNDPEGREPDLCTTDLVGGPIPFDEARLGVEFPACE